MDDTTLRAWMVKQTRVLIDMGDDPVAVLKAMRKQTPLLDYAEDQT